MLYILGFGGFLGQLHVLVPQKGCVCVCTYVCVYIYIYIYIQMHTYIRHTYRHTCIHKTYIDTCLHTCRHILRPHVRSSVSKYILRGYMNPWRQLPESTAPQITLNPKTVVLSIQTVSRQPGGGYLRPGEDPGTEVSKSLNPKPKNLNREA